MSRKVHTQHTLYAGPYLAPPCKVGDPLHCEMFGDVTVRGFSRAPVRWPLCYPKRWKGRPFGAKVPILCGDLVRAVCEESAHAVSEHWGASITLVRRWRELIAGTKEDVATYLAIKRLDPEFRARFYPEASISAS